MGLKPSARSCGSRRMSQVGAAAEGWVLASRCRGAQDMAMRCRGVRGKIMLDLPTAWNIIKR